MNDALDNINNVIYGVDEYKNDFNKNRDIIYNGFMYLKMNLLDEFEDELECLYAEIYNETINIDDIDLHNVICNKHDITNSIDYASIINMFKHIRDKYIEKFK